MSLLIAGPAPPAATVAQAVFTCATTGCKQKPGKACVISTGKNKGKTRPEGPHAPRLLAATEHLRSIANA